MHTFQGNSATFLYNSLIDSDSNEKVIIKQHSDINIPITIEIDINDIINFIAEAFVRPNLINSIEQTAPKDLLLNQIDIIEK